MEGYNTSMQANSKISHLTTHRRGTAGFSQYENVLKALWANLKWLDTVAAC
jgi:hypothetical protein